VLASTKEYPQFEKERNFGFLRFSISTIAKLSGIISSNRASSEGISGTLGEGALVGVCVGTVVGLVVG